MSEQIEILVAKVNKSRSNIFAMIVFSIVNAVLVIFNATINFPFSIIFPTISIEIGKILRVETNSPAPYYIAIALSVICVGVYFLFHFLSKKSPVFYIALLVLFSVDSILLLIFTALAFEISLLIDIAFHGWVMYYIVMAVICSKKITDIFREKQNQENVEEYVQNDSFQQINKE
jgi:hypothetical protein